MRVVLYQPEIYQNTCGIIRVCACLGVGLDLIYPLGFPFNISSPDSEMKRIVMDYRCDIKTHDSWDKFLNHYDGFRFILFTPHSGYSFKRFEFFPDDLLIFGRESSGVDLAVFSQCHSLLSIPMEKNNRSLNLLSSVSLVLSLV